MMELFSFFDGQCDIGAATDNHNNFVIISIKRLSENRKVALSDLNIHSS